MVWALTAWSLREGLLGAMKLLGTGRKPGAQKNPGGNPGPKQSSGAHYPLIARAAVRRCGNPREGLCA